MVKQWYGAVRQAWLSHWIVFGFLGALSGSLLGSDSREAWGVEPSAVSAQNKLGQFEEALQGAFQRLGSTEAWQRKLFQEEVLSMPSRFIRDYRAASNGQLSVEVDQASLRNYLRFYAPAVFGVEKPELGLYWTAQPGAKKCADSALEVRKSMNARLDRRGWVPRWAKRLASGWDPPPLLNSESKNVGYLMLSCAAVAPDVDSAHADEVRYQVNASLVLKGQPRQEGQLEFDPDESVEVVISRLLTDFFTDLGASLKEEGSGPGSTALKAQRERREDLLLEISGIRDFALYQKLRAAMGGLGSSGIAFEERKISKGKVLFGVLTKKSAEEVTRALLALEMERGKLVSEKSSSDKSSGEPSSDTPSMIRMELK